MPSLQPLVLDANILIRAVLGEKVRNFLIDFNRLAGFFIPDTCLEEVKKYLPIILQKRSIPPDPAFEILSKLKDFLQIVDASFYSEQKEEAKQRIKNRDINDWPVVATALTLNCPIWTEDQDFFGTGLPIWTTDRIHLFFKNKELLATS